MNRQTNGDGLPSGRNETKIPRGVKMLVRRHLRLVAKGKSCFDQANVALAAAINCGLRVGVPIELKIVGEDGESKKEQFYLVDNFDQDVVYKSARVAHYDFKKIPKTKRAPTAVETAAPATQEAA